MPHSVSPEANSPIAVPDETMADSPVPPNADGDVAMAEADAPAVAAPEAAAPEASAPEPSATEQKKDIKLEDLFDDADSDDEFPSSKPQETPESSPEILTPPSPT